MRNQKLHRTTESFLDGIDIVGVDPRNERCLRLIGIFSQIFTTYVWNYSVAPLATAHTRAAALSLTA